MQIRPACVLSVLLVLSAVSAGPKSALAQPDSPFDKLKFLLGEWTGEGSGSPGSMISGGATFKFDLDKNIIVRKNRAEFAPKPGEKSGAVHEDLMIIYQQPGDPGLRAIYFDNEGHTINYRLSFPTKQPSVVFESDASDKTPRFRLVHETGPGGTLTSEFFIAPPGGEFKSYVKGTMKKKR